MRVGEVKSFDNYEIKLQNLELKTYNNYKAIIGNLKIKNYSINK